MSDQQNVTLISLASFAVGLLVAVTRLKRAWALPVASLVRVVLFYGVAWIKGMGMRDLLDGGWGTQGGRRLSYQRQTDALGAILPNNSPGVHNLWVPAIPLKVALVLKPGSAEPCLIVKLSRSDLRRVPCRGVL